MWSSREDSEEKSPPAEAPAPGPAERKSTTNGDDARPAGLLHEPHELSTSTLTKLEAASDDQNNKTVKSPYYIGRNLCVRGRGHKPLSLWCPEACGCHRGDQDCPLQCPERDATTPICPAHQRRTFLPGCQDEFSPELCCPRHPRAYGFDVGFSSVGTSGTARAAAAGE